MPTAPYEAAVVRSDRILRRLVRGLDGISLRVGSGGGSGNSDGEMVPAASRTLVVVVGDHGEAFGEGGHRQHGSCVHVACLQVPFVVFDPFSHSTMMAAMTRITAAVPPAAVRWREGLTSHADVMATVLHWAGLALANSSTVGTILRRGVSILPNGANDHAATSSSSVSLPLPLPVLRTALPVYSFFNPQVSGALLVGRPKRGAVGGWASRSGSDNRTLTEVVVDRSRSRLARRVTLESSSSSAAAAGLRNLLDGPTRLSTTGVEAASLKQSAAWQRALQQQRVAVRFLYRQLLL